MKVFNCTPGHEGALCARCAADYYPSEGVCIPCAKSVDEGGKGDDGLVKAALAQMGRRLEGQDPRQVEVLWDKMARAANIFSGDAGRVGATAISAVDQALTRVFAG